MYSMLWLIILALTALIIVLISFINSLSKTVNNVSRFSNGIAWKLKEKGIFDKEDIDWINAFVKGQKGVSFDMIKGWMKESIEKK